MPPPEKFCQVKFGRSPPLKSFGLTHGNTGSASGIEGVKKWGRGGTPWGHPWGLWELSFGDLRSPKFTGPLPKVMWTCLWGYLGCTLGTLGHPKAPGSLSWGHWNLPCGHGEAQNSGFSPKETWTRPWGYLGHWDPPMETLENPKIPGSPLKSLGLIQKNSKKISQNIPKHTPPQQQQQKKITKKFEEKFQNFLPV